MKYLVNQKNKKIFNGNIPRYNKKINIIEGVEIELAYLHNNKKVYMKEFPIGNLPNSGRSIIKVDMPSNIELIEISGFCKKSNEGNAIDIVNIMQLTSLLLYRDTSNEIYIDTITDRTMYRGWVKIIYQYKNK